MATSFSDRGAKLSHASAVAADDHPLVGLGHPPVSTDPTRLWQLISPTLPVGAYHYSQGLEQAVSSGWVPDEASAHAWIAGLLEATVAKVDLPILIRAHAAWRERDATAVQRWDDLARACRETAELREEDANMGAALMRLARTLNAQVPDQPLGFAAAFAVLASDWDIAPGDMARGYAWSWCENQVAAALKLVPLGHSAGQRTLRRLGEAVDRAVGAAFACGDEEIGGLAPGHALACAWHETKEVRLFRS